MKSRQLEVGKQACAGGRQHQRMLSR
jgi:hypothetical protein